MRREKRGSVADVASPFPDHSGNFENSKAVSSESLKQVMMMASNLDENSLPLNENHITEILSQRREITGYIHEDRKRDFEKFKHESWDKKFFYAIGVFVWLIVFVFSMMFYKEQVITILAATATFLGGYGLGSKSKQELKK